MGVNVYQCQSSAIVGMFVSLALVCCSDLLFCLSLPLYLTGLVLFFMLQSLSNELFHVAVQYCCLDSRWQIMSSCEEEVFGCTKEKASIKLLMHG